MRPCAKGLKVRIRFPPAPSRTNSRCGGQNSESSHPRSFAGCLFDFEAFAQTLALEQAIIAQRTGSLDPTTYRDRYQETLRELLEAKMKGLTVKPREIAAPPPVIDLMAALKRSPAREASGSKHTAPKKANKMAPDQRQLEVRIRFPPPASRANRYRCVRSRLKLDP